MTQSPSAPARERLSRRFRLSAGQGWNLVASACVIAVVFLILTPILRWGLVDAVWSGDVAACRAPGAGACWAFVGEKMRFMVFGFYPAEQQWRPLLVILLFVAATVASCFPPFWRFETVVGWGLNLAFMFTVMSGGEWPFRTLVAITAIGWYAACRGSRNRALQSAAPILAIGLGVLFLAWPAVPPVFGLLIVALILCGRAGRSAPRLVLLHVVAAAGGVLALASVYGLSYQRTGTWSGLPLTIWLSTLAMIGAFPLAIFLALGRRARLPLVRAICIGIIESVRGVPLITLLFMAAFLLPILLGSDAFDKLARIQLILILFIACYLAEIIRGGLQAIPKGQFEAAASLGLRFWPSMLLIVLPQVFRIAIPSIINLAINIFKDTSLVLIVGLFDFLQAVRASMADSNWLGISTEGYVFAALVYFVFCFSASRLSLMVEHKLKAPRSR